MSDVAQVGIDLGKHSFHLHGQDKPGREVFRKKLSRQQMMRFFGNLPRLHRGDGGLCRRPFRCQGAGGDGA